MSITAETIGTFVDGVAGKKRTPSAVAGRLLEEVVELALAAGLDTGKIMSHVADALHNQALKTSRAAGHTVFPSALDDDPSELPGECADVGIVLKDLCYVAGIDLAQAETEKWGQFTKKHFRVTENGVIYAKKSHVRGPDECS